MITDHLNAVIYDNEIYYSRNMSINGFYTVDLLQLGIEKAREWKKLESELIEDLANGGMTLEARFNAVGCRTLLLDVRGHTGIIKLKNGKKAHLYMRGRFNKKHQEYILKKFFDFIELRQKLSLLFAEPTSAAISEKTGTREWDKPDTPPTTITLSTLRTSAAIFRRVGICA